MIPARYVILRPAAHEPVVHRHRPAGQLTTWCGVQADEGMGWAMADASNLHPDLRLCRRCYPGGLHG